MKKTSTTKISTLPILGMAIVFSFSALFMASCGGGNSNKDTAANASSSSGKKQNTNSIVGKWIATEGLKTSSYEFMENGSYIFEQITKKEDPETGPDTMKEGYSYRITNDNKLELFNFYSNEILETGSFAIENNGNTLAKTVNGATLKLSRVKTN